MKIMYEKISDVLYIRAKKSKVEKTVKLNGHTLIDLDKAGNLIGIEVLFASKHLPKRIVASRSIFPHALRTIVV